MSDVVDNRIERNLRAVSHTPLVELPSDESYSADKFLSVQERLVRTQAELLASKNVEVEEAVGDLLELIATHPLRDGAAAVARRRLVGHGTQPRPGPPQACVRAPETYPRAHGRRGKKITKKKFESFTI